MGYLTPRTLKEMLSMELNETVYVRAGLEITRVPGGWLYIFGRGEVDVRLPFVKFVGIPEHDPVDELIEAGASNQKNESR